MDEDEKETLAILDSFAEKLIESQTELDPESQKLLNDNFWDLLA